MLGCCIESLIRIQSPFDCGKNDIILNYYKLDNLPMIPTWGIGALILILLKAFFDWTGTMKTDTIIFYTLATICLIIFECNSVRIGKFLNPKLYKKMYDNIESKNVNYWKGYEKKESLLTWCEGRNSLKASVLFFICTILFYKFIHPIFE